MNKATIIFIFIGIIFATNLVKSMGRIGEGDHDVIAAKLNEMKAIFEAEPLEQLKQEALKMEAYINKKSGHFILGGLHDYIENIEKEQLVQIMSRMLLNNVELLDINVYQSVVSPSEQTLGFLEVEQPAKFGGLHDYINTIDEATLRKWSLAADRYIYETTGSTLIGGGIHDRIVTMKKPDFIEYLLNSIAQYPILDSSVKLNKLCVSYGFTNESQEPQFVGGLVDYIWRQSDDVLRQWALTCERYEKENKNITIIGGLVDYVRVLNKEELIKIVLNYANKYPELNSNVKLNQLAISYGISQPEELPGAKKEEAPQMVGGLEDYIWRENKDVLLQWAYTCNRYVDEQRTIRIPLIGGPSKYFHLMNKEQLIKLILNYASKYPDLNSKVKLNQLAESYEISIPTELPEAKEEAPQMVGGLVDYIWRMPEETLSQWALTCEKYDRESRKVDLDGGLHDYVSRLSKQQLMNIILDYTKIYPELNSGLKLTELAMSYGFTPKLKSQKPAESVMAGGLHDYIWRVKTDVLFSWAVTCDEYDRKMRKVNIKGRLVDYILLLEKEQLIRIILDFAKQYPELNSADKLQELATSYGIAVEEEN